MIKKPYFEGYNAEFDSVDKQQWCDFLSQFEDATIYQTWSYAKVRWGEKKLSHLVLKKGSEVAAMAQVVVREVPFFKIGIAYIPWGPLWHRNSCEEDVGVLKNMLRAIKYFYGKKKKLLIRIAPHQIESEGRLVANFYNNEGFTRTSSSPYRTFLLDLRSSLDEIRKQFKSKWRNGLNKAEKKGLTVNEGTDDTDYRTFLSLQKEMMTIKSFTSGVDYNEFRKIQNDLRSDIQMRILTCLYEGQPVASLVGSMLGNKGIYLLGASNDTGRKLCASYLLQWKMIECLKMRGIRYYDLGGINPSINPGVFHFKAGLKGKDVTHVGYFETCFNPLSSFLTKFYENAQKKFRNICL